MSAVAAAVIAGIMAAVANGTQLVVLVQTPLMIVELVLVVRNSLGK